MVSPPQALVFESSAKREHTGDPGDREGEKAEGRGFPKGVNCMVGNTKQTQSAGKREKFHQPAMAATPETSCLLRGQQCSSRRGCSREEAGRRRIQRLQAAVYTPPKHQSHFSTYRFFSLLAPATVQVGGETEGKESKQLPTTSCSVQPKGKHGAQTQRCKAAFCCIEQHLPDNCPQCSDGCILPQPCLRGSQKAATLEEGF